MDPQDQNQIPPPQPLPPPLRQFSSTVRTMLPLFIGIVAVISMSAVQSSSGSLSLVHQVPEGHVGAYWRGGALLQTITNPGFHWKMPILTQFEPIQVTIQTDEVRNIPCGTKGGVMITFEKVEVVNRLRKDYVYETLLNYSVNYDKTWIYDKIHHEINQFCSSHTLQQVYIDMFDQIDENMREAIQRDCTYYAPGIEIISVRITKPKIPDSVRRNFEQMEEERTKVLVAVEKQKVAEKEAETLKKIAMSEAEKNAQVSKILMEQKLMEKDSSRRQQEIENAMYLAREKSLADANFYRVMREAEANTMKLTPQFLQLKFIEAVANNSKIFFGNKLPNLILDQRLLGDFLKTSASSGNLENPRVVFSAYSIPHPSENKVNIRVQTTGDPARDVLKDSLPDLMTMPPHVRKRFDKAVNDFRIKEPIEKMKIED